MQLAIMFAQDAEESSPNFLVTLLPFLIIGFIMYLLLIRPQRKKMREQAELQSSIGVGDEIITTSGIYGFITGEEDDRFWLEIDDDVQIRIARAAVQRKVDTAKDDEDADDADGDEATASDEASADADES